MKRPRALLKWRTTVRGFRRAPGPLFPGGAAAALLLLASEAIRRGRTTWLRVALAGLALLLNTWLVRAVAAAVSTYLSRTPIPDPDGAQ